MTSTPLDMEIKEHRPAIWQSPLALALATVVIGALYGISLAASISPVLLIGAPIGLVIAVLAVTKPEYAAVALVGITWGYISEIANKFHGIPSLTKPLVVLLVGMLILRRFSGRRTPLVYDSTIWWMLAYLFVVALGMWYAKYPDLAQDLTIDFGKDVLLFVVIINLVNSQKLFERTVWLLLAIGALIGTLTVYQEITQSYNSIFGGLARMKFAYIAEGLPDRPRAGGPTSEPLAFGQQMLVLIPLGLWAMLQATTIPRRLLAAYATAACMAGLGLSFSRSTYIALLVVLGLFALHIKLNPRYLLGVVPLVLVLIFVAPPELRARFSTLEALLPGNEGVSADGSFNRRSVEMQSAFYMFVDYPVLGIGGGNSRKYYPLYIRESGAPVEDAERNAHNFYLEVAAEHGVIGFVAWAGILVMTWTRLRAARRLFKEAGNFRAAELASALQIGFIGYLITALFLHGVYARFLWLQVALAIALFTIARRSTQQAPTERVVQAHSLGSLRQAS